MLCTHSIGLIQYEWKEFVLENVFLPFLVNTKFTFSWLSGKFIYFPIDFIEFSKIKKLPDYFCFGNVPDNLKHITFFDFNIEHQILIVINIILCVILFIIIIIILYWIERFFEFLIKKIYYLIK